MSKEGSSSLKKRIIEEMAVDHGNALGKNFDLAKQLVRITKDGKVDVQFKEKFTGQEQILLYLIGKLYAKEADFASTSDAGNKELMDELGIPVGSLLPWLKGLRDAKKINPIKRGRNTYHYIAANAVEKTLKRLTERLKKDI